MALIIGGDNTPFLSTLSLRRATVGFPHTPTVCVISIHALLAESDPVAGGLVAGTRAISIHALLAESDGICTGLWHALQDFYPRSPCGERQLWQCDRPKAEHFYPRSPCGERRSAQAAFPPGECISIHALLAESDHAAHFFSFFWGNFYPRSPCGERRKFEVLYIIDQGISIHALLAESDLILAVRVHKRRISIHALLAESDAALNCIAGTASYFYPRSPCGERPVAVPEMRPNGQFLSTLSLRRATLTQAQYDNAKSISIHALLAESDLLTWHPAFYGGKFLSTLSLRRATAARRRFCPRRCHFYPRSPCGERRAAVHEIGQEFEISIHALLAESDFFVRYVFADGKKFLSTLSLRRATTDDVCGCRRYGDFYPRSPCGERQRHNACRLGAGAISIHALLAESDTAHAAAACALFYFYPRSPCGERRYRDAEQVTFWQFLSTLSLRRATYFRGETL